MKIILGVTGGGKTNTVIEMMAELSNKGEKCLVVSGEYDDSYFSRKLIEADANLEVLRYQFATQLDDVIKVIESEEHYPIQHIFIDMGATIVSGTPKGISEADALETIYQAGEINSKSIYITLQTNKVGVDGEKIAIVDYEAAEIK